MGDAFRKEQFPDKNLPTDISVTTSVLEVERTKADQKLKSVLGDRISDLLIDPTQNLPKYGCSVSFEEDTSWVYIDETWNQNGYEMYRTATTGTRPDDNHLGLFIKSPAEIAGGMDNKSSLEVDLDEEKNITFIRGSSQRSYKFDNDSIPYSEDFLNISCLSDVEALAKQKFDPRGNVLNLQFEIERVGEDLNLKKANLVSLVKAGNGYKMQRILFENGEIKYGEELTNSPLFTAVRTYPLKEK